ncbi:hypothetical protein [Frigoribacterium sp. PhB24]|uniref:hypothetical protein n=1 Tax=Frigoribacterium sp. PhB24 TaxID=2485204 RepID=UPI00131540A9|nr:hypothetical protein [Frigoribacterium sp. PhB24]
MLPSPIAGLNRFASVRSSASCAASRGMTGVSARAGSERPASARRRSSSVRLPPLETACDRESSPARGA